MQPTEHDPFAGPALSVRLPLTEAQREIWLACELEPEATLTFNEASRTTLRGPLKVDVLLTSLQVLVARHESLRASFSADGSWMTVREQLRLEVPVIDIAADPEGLRAKHEAALVAAAFDLAQGPLIRFVLLRESDTTHHLLRCVHHIVGDGWSAWVLSQELGKLYSAALETRDPGLEPAPRYGDYAQLEREFVASDEGRRHLDYWLTLLRDPPRPLDLPHDKPRPAQRSFEAARVDIAFDTALVARLRKLGASHGASLVATTLAAFAATLHRLTGAAELIVGLAAAGQSFHDQKGLVGHAVNLLPVRLKPASAEPFTALLAQTRSAVLDAFDHQGVSFGSIVPQLKFERDPARPPLISAIFNIDVRSGDIGYAGLTMEYHVLERRAELFELFVNMVDNGRDLVLECSYNTALFSAAAITRCMRQLERVLAAVCEDAAQPLATLPLLSPEERAQFTAAPAIIPAPSRLLHEWFAEAAAATPDAIALRFEATSLSYAELDARANRLAQFLRTWGVGPEVAVGLYLDRSLETVVAILGVLKAGGAYLPMDPLYPPERVSFMLEDAKAPIVLTQAALAERLPAGTPLLRLDHDWDAEIATLPGTAPVIEQSPESLAYIIYTSGSTGKPKGCLLTHANVARLFTSTAPWFGFGATDVWTLFHSYAFDFSVWELWGALLYGGRLVVVPQAQARDPEDFRRLLAAEGVTVLNQTPSAFRQLIAADAVVDSTTSPLALRTVIFGGEALDFAMLRDWFARHGDGSPDSSGGRGPRLVNMYGITETTVHVTYRPVTQADVDAQDHGRGGRSLIGAPIPDLSLYVLDGALQPLPPGVTGELFVGGAGVARGYLNRQELSAQRFIEHPFGHPGRLYRTGDLARRSFDGDIEYLGRIDHQVKLRGFRIELGEIETRLAAHERIGGAFVTVLERAPGDPRLVAYLVWRDARAPANASELRSHLRATLPDYMVPQHFQELAAFPLTGNGKLDRAALPSPFASATAAQTRTPPRSDTERAVAEIWSEVLGVSGIGVEDRFFDLGGHSLLAVRAAAKLRERFGAMPLLLRSILMDTLGQIAAQCEGARVARETAAATASAVTASLPRRPIAAATAAAAPAPGLLGHLRRWLGR